MTYKLTSYCTERGTTKSLVDALYLWWDHPGWVPMWNIMGTRTKYYNDRVVSKWPTSNHTRVDPLKQSGFGEYKLHRLRQVYSNCKFSAKVSHSLSRSLWINIAYGEADSPKSHYFCGSLLEQFTVQRNGIWTIMWKAPLHFCLPNGPAESQVHCELVKYNHNVIELATSAYRADSQILRIDYTNLPVMT